MASSQLHQVLPRIWVLEALAQSEQVDINLLQDLLEDIPKAFDGISRNARELVFLRILESLLPKGACEYSKSSISSKRMKLDPSERCEDVVKKIYAPWIHSDRSDLSKLDLLPFIEHKRSNLGKCTLQKLKDALLTGKPSLDAFVKEQVGLTFDGYPSGLGICSASTVSMNRNEINENLLLQRYLQDKNLLHARRKTKPVVENSGGNYEGVEVKTCENKKRKYQIEGLCDLRMTIVDQVSILKDEKAADLREGSQGDEDRNIVCPNNDAGDTGKNGSNFSGKNICIESNVVRGDNGLVPREEQASHHSELLNEKSDGEYDLDDEERNIIGTNNDVEGIGKNRFTLSDNTKCFKTDQLLFSDDIMPHDKQASRCSAEVENAKFDRGYVPISNADTAFSEGSDQLTMPTEAIDKFQCHNDGDSERIVGTSCHIDENPEDVDVRKKTHLSSQSTYSQYILVTPVLEEKNICIKCNKSGKLLVCRSSSCPVITHESCLGTEARFEAGGIFYCPFCAYSRAITKFNEIKEKNRLARNDLKNFFFNQNIVEQANKKHAKNSEFAPDGSLELQSGYCLPFGGRNIAKADAGEVNGRACAMGECKERGKKTSWGSKSHESNGHQLKNELVNNVNGGESASRESLPTCEHKQSSISDSEDFEEENRDGFRKVLKQKSTRPPRKSEPNWWTVAETDALMEGARIYLGPNKSTTPWKSILVFGAGRFNPSRRASDLKDKWRNICKVRNKRSTEGS